MQAGKGHLVPAGEGRLISQTSIVADLVHRLSEPQAEERVAANSSSSSHAHSRNTSTDTFFDAPQLQSLDDLREAVQVEHDMQNLVDEAKQATSLVLSGRSLGDRGLRALVSAFREGSSRGSSLLELDLSNNSLTPQGVQHLADALEFGVFPALAELHISNNYLGDDGAEMISRVLRDGHHSTLECLGLSNCSIGEYGMHTLADALQSGNFSAMGLKSLDFSYNLFGEQSVVALTRAVVMRRLPELKRLNLSNNVLAQEGTSALSEVFSAGYLSGLTHLNLSRCYLSGEMIPIFRAMEMGGLPNLQALDVSGNRIGRSGSAALATALRSGRVAKLQLLNLGQCGIGGEEMEIIADGIEVEKLRDLQFLDLSLNSLDSLTNSQSQSDSYPPMVNDRGSLALASLMSRGNLSRLQYLDLSQCSIGDQGLVALAERMASGNLPVLQRFFFEGNDISSKKSIKALVRALESGNLAFLEELELGHNSWGEDVTMALAGALLFSSAQGPVVEKLKQKLRKLRPVDNDVMNHLKKFWVSRSFRGLEVVKVDEKEELKPAGEIFNKYLERQYSQKLPPIVNEDHTQPSTSTFFINWMLLGAWLLVVMVAKLKWS